MTEHAAIARGSLAFVEAGARGRLAWVGSFFGLSTTYLAVRGAPVAIVLTQAAFVLVSVATSWRAARRGVVGVDAVSLGAALACAFVGIGATGGIASPLVLAIVPLHASVDAASGARKLGVFGQVAAACALGLLSIVPVLDTVAPNVVPAYLLAVHLPTLDYAVLALATVAFVVRKQFDIARGVHRAYELIADELSARRHELFEEAEARTRSLEGIAARLAHEVKNPLAAIKGLSRHLEKTATEPKTAERLAIVAQEADRLAAIVDGFLSFSRGLDDLHVALLKPYDLARELMLLLDTRASELGVTIEVSGPVDLVLEGDGRKLRQALLNLCLNALQASPGAATVTLEVVRVEPADVEFRVIDRGCGMSPEVIERIRRPYFTTRDGGSGLGVAVARGIVEQHGGALTHESRAGVGTIATMRVPQRYAGASALALPRPSTPVGGR